MVHALTRYMPAKYMPLTGEMYLVHQASGNYMSMQQICMLGEQPVSFSNAADAYCFITKMQDKLPGIPLLLLHCEI